MEVLTKTHDNFTLDPIKGKRAILILIDTIYKLGKQNVKCWISAGTALGLYRDEKLIDHDTDIDIGILGGQDVTLDEHLIREAWYEGRIMQRAYMVSDVIVDLFFYYEEGDKLVNYSDVGKIEKTKDYIGYPIPALDLYIPERYGKDWNIPKTSKQGRNLDCNNLVGT